MFSQKSSATIWDVNVQNAHIARLGRSHFGVKLKHCEVTAKRDFNNNLIVLYARTEDECGAWVNALHKASERQLEDYYEILHLIGEGGFAKVRLGRSLATGERCAIKTMNKAEAHTKVVGTEVAIIKRVNHPNIVKTYDIFETSEYIHIVMEYMEGGMLYDSIEDGVRFEEADVVQFMRELLDGVLYLHEMGIVHRDIKPENVLCTSKQTPLHVKIADFGLSSISSVADMKANCMLMSTVIGTPEFVAPEIARQETYTEKVDMWALGMLCYNVIARKLPLDESFDMISQIQHGITLTFPEPEWQIYSPMARSFIRSLLCSEAEKRLSPLGCLVHPWLSAHVPEKSTKFGAHGRMSTFMITNIPHKLAHSNFSAKRQWHKIFISVCILCKLVRLSGVSRIFEPARLRAMTLRNVKRTDIERSASNESETTKVTLGDVCRVGYDSLPCLPKVYFSSVASAASNSQPATPGGGVSRSNSEAGVLTDCSIPEVPSINGLEGIAGPGSTKPAKGERSASEPFAIEKQFDMEFGDLDLGDEPEDLEQIPHSLGNFPLSFRGLGHDVSLPRLPLLRKKVRAAFGAEGAKIDTDVRGTRKGNLLKKNLPSENEDAGGLSKEWNDDGQSLGGLPVPERVINKVADGRTVVDRKLSLRKKIISSLTRDPNRAVPGSKWTLKWMRKDGRIEDTTAAETSEDSDRAIGQRGTQGTKSENETVKTDDEKDNRNSNDKRAITKTNDMEIKLKAESKHLSDQGGAINSSFETENGKGGKKQGAWGQEMYKRTGKKNVLDRNQEAWEANDLVDRMSPITPIQQRQVPYTN